MTPVPAQRSKPVYLDRADRIAVGHALAAAGLMLAHHELVGVVGGQFLFRKSAKDDLDRFNRYADEARALLERAHARQHHTEPRDNVGRRPGADHAQ